MAGSKRYSSPPRTPVARDVARYAARDGRGWQGMAGDGKGEQAIARESKREQERARESKREQERARERVARW